MKNFSDTDYIKSEYKKINNLFLQGKYNLVKMQIFASFSLLFYVF